MKQANSLTTGISEPEVVVEFLKKLKHPMKDVIEYLRKVILETDRSIGECIFWNAPTFYFSGKMKPFDAKEYKRYIVGFNFFKQDTLRLIFLRGAGVSDGKKLLEGDYKDGRRILSITGMADAKAKEKELKKIVKQLIKMME